MAAAQASFVPIGPTWVTRIVDPDGWAIAYEYVASKTPSR
jgi:hypothetical protein